MNTLSTQYPELFNVLKQEVRTKAMSIANLLILEGLKPEQAHCVAASNASCCNLESNTDVHLIPHPAGWALISSDAIIFHFTCISYNEALGKARNKAKSEKLKLFIHSVEGNIVDAESFKVNRPSTIPQSRFYEEEEYMVVADDKENRAYVFHSRLEALRRVKNYGRKDLPNVSAAGEDDSIRRSF